MIYRKPQKIQTLIFQILKLQIRARLPMFILMVSPIHIDTPSMELSIFYFKGLPVKISIK